MKTSAKIALGVAVVGTAVAIGVYIRRRSKKTLSRSGATMERVEGQNGAVSTIYTSAMPIEERVGHIQDMVWKSVKNPSVRQLGLAITGCGTREVRVGAHTYIVEGACCVARDGACEVDAVGQWVAENIRYTGDIAPVKHGRNGKVEGVDVFQTAERTAEYGGEDCDGHTIANSSLLAVNGVQSKLAVTAPSKFGSYGHIYTEAMLPKNDPSGFVAVDTTLPGYQTGQEAPFGRKRRFDA
jgi:hypothetical protein